MPKYKAEFHDADCGNCGQHRKMMKDDYQCLICRGMPDPIQTRLELAEDVCWTLLMMMALGGLEIEQEWRDYLAGPYEKWADQAVRTGVMDQGEDDATPDETQEKDKEAEANEAAGDHGPGSSGSPS